MTITAPAASAFDLDGLVVEFDGRDLARGWLAIANAAGADKDVPVLYRTVAIEVFNGRGLRLYATDQYMLLRTWVPSFDNEDGGTAPDIDEQPDRVVVVRDGDGRARNFLGYVLALAARNKSYCWGDIALAVEFDVRAPAEQTEQATLDGMEPRYVVLSVPDVERVYLEVIEATFPDWRPFTHEHQPTPTHDVTLSPELMERVAKVRKHAAGALALHFGAPGRAILLDYRRTDPPVHGALMPREADAGERDACPDCAAAMDDPTSHVCLRHGVALVRVTHDELAEKRAVHLADPDVDVDDVLVHAAELVVSTQLASAAMLQRKLRVGYAHSVLILELLEALAIVGPETGPRKHRDVLIPAAGLEQLLADLRDTAPPDDRDPPSP